MCFVISECACKADKPCSCGYSPEQCTVHCSKTRPYDSGYVLPVRYDNNGGDYVVYELPQDASAQQLSRAVRQTNTPSDAILDLFSRDSPFKAAVDRIRDRVSKLRFNDASESTLGSTLDTSALRNRFTDRISSIADFFTQNFALPPLPTRRRREAPTTESERRELMDKRIPMLRVKEYEPNHGNYDDLSKYTSTSRVKLPKTDDQQKTLSEKESDGTKHCHECGTKLSNSVCTRCGSHQSQYVEYSTGKPLPFYPGARSVAQPTVESRSSPQYIFDRYGHKYIENNGNLRLIVPQQHQEAMVGDQPDFAGLADILNGNQGIIRQLNPVPGRVMPEPMDIATDAISLVHDLANREPEKRSTKYERAAATEESDNKKKSERHFPRSMYQVVPMSYEGKDGKLVVKVYSSKSDKANTISTATTDATDAEKLKPTVHMFNKDNKQFEILSFEDYKNSSNEDIRQVLEHLHGKQSW